MSCLDCPDCMQSTWHTVRTEMCEPAARGNLGKRPPHRKRHVLALPVVCGEAVLGEQVA